jgi:hypothetical protein
MIKVLITVFLVKRVPGQGLEQKEPDKAVLCPLIIIILITYIIFKFLIMENHPSQNGKWYCPLITVVSKHYLLIFG